MLAGIARQPTLRVTPPYYDDPIYIEALAVSINAASARRCRSSRTIIVASFHGMPQAYVDKGDPYQAQCVATTGRAAQAAWALTPDPAAADLPVALRLRRVAAALHRQDHREACQGGRAQRIAVVTPGFSADCLETLEEIAQENAEIFKHNGGEQFSAIPCLNDSDAGMDVIRQLVLRELAMAEALSYAGL